MIKSFKNKEVEEIFNNSYVKRFANAERMIRRKLLILNAAGSLQDLMIPVGNRLEALQGDREGQYSVRVNDRFRICFIWKDKHAYEVDVVDYH